MKPTQALEIIHAAIKSEDGFTPFSNGTEAEGWLGCNCYECRRSMSCYDPDKWEQQTNRDGGVSATASGLHCFGEYAIGVGYMTGKVPVEISEWMGGTETHLPNQCRFFTDDENFDMTRQGPPPDPHQLRIPFLTVELFGFADPDILVFDKALIEKDALSLTAV